MRWLLASSWHRRQVKAWVGEVWGEGVGDMAGQADESGHAITNGSPRRRTQDEGVDAVLTALCFGVARNFIAAQRSDQSWVVPTPLLSLPTSQATNLVAARRDELALALVVLAAQYCWRVVRLCHRRSPGGR